MKWLLLAVVFVSGIASAKEVVQGERAKAMYEELVQVQKANPEAVTSTTSMFFGDDRHPELGRLWFTTIAMKVHPKVFCYQYDYREAGVIDYLCEVNAI